MKEKTLMQLTVFANFGIEDSIWNPPLNPGRKNQGKSGNK